jgi:hypothetical protein
MKNIAFAQLTEDLADYRYAQAYNWIKSQKLAVYKNQTKLQLSNHPTSHPSTAALHTLTRSDLPL